MVHDFRRPDYSFARTRRLRVRKVTAASRDSRKRRGATDRCSSAAVWAVTRKCAVAARREREEAQSGPEVAAPEAQRCDSGQNRRCRAEDGEVGEVDAVAERVVAGVVV